MKLRHTLLIVLVAVLLVGSAVVYAQARPVAPDVAFGYLVHGMTHGATAQLECGNGWFHVVTQTVSIIEVECRPWVMAPGE